MPQEQTGQTIMAFTDKFFTPAGLSALVDIINENGTLPRGDKGHFVKRTPEGLASYMNAVAERDGDEAALAWIADADRDAYTRYAARALGIEVAL